MDGLADLNGLSLAELYRSLAGTGLVGRLVELGRDEDLGSAGDVTTEACFGEEERGKVVSARIVARVECIVSGLAALGDVAACFGGGIEVVERSADGERVCAGSVVAEVRGAVGAVLGMERLALNVLGRLSGVATLTRRYVETVAREAPGSPARLLDTRKTTPGLRVLEKYAVRCGGGMCHRIGLHDAVLIKDNHLAGVGIERLGGFVEDAAGWARAHRAVRFVEVEVDTLEQLRVLLLLEPGVLDVILLDNMTVEVLAQAVLMRNDALSGVLLEASGGVSLGTVGGIARTGVDRISVGALTHQSVGMDFGMDFA